jgi:hypothetical protein
VRRFHIEVLLALVTGWCALALPVLAADHTHYDAAFLPVMRDVVEGIRPLSLGLLLVAGACLGAFAEAPTWVLGPGSVASLPAWSAIDMFMGADHNLFPIEWTIYAFYALTSTVGAILGRAIRKKISRTQEVGSRG